MKHLFLAVVVALSIFMVAVAYDRHERAARHHHLSSIRAETLGQRGSEASKDGDRENDDAGSMVGDEAAY